MFCPRCGTEVTGSRCPGCGEFYKTKCGSCGAVLPYGSAFCSRCGKSLVVEHVAKTKSKEQIPVYGIWSVLSGVVSLVCSFFVFSKVLMDVSVGNPGVAVAVMEVLAAYLMFSIGVTSIAFHRHSLGNSFVMLMLACIDGILCLVLMILGSFDYLAFSTWWLIFCAAVFLWFVVRAYYS